MCPAYLCSDPVDVPKDVVKTDVVARVRLRPVRHSQRGFRKHETQLK